MTPSWEELAKDAPKRLVRSTDAIGIRCATDYCKVTRGVTYEKPLCYRHWKDFDRYLISECDTCHWFGEDVGGSSDEDLCYECYDRERRGYPPSPVYAHGPVQRRIRYLYILKLNGELDGPSFYVGQTNSPDMRLQEHLDGVVLSTKGKNPKLVWFEEWIGNRRGLNQAEDALTRLANLNSRAIRVKVAAWQRPLRLVDLQV